VTPYPLQYAGQAWPEKVADLRKILETKKLDAMVVSEHVNIIYQFGTMCLSKVVHNYVVERG
jgi:hypothetical protein